MGFSILHRLFDSVLELCFWILFIYVWFWDFTDTLMGSFGFCSDTPYINDIIQAYMFFVMMTFIENILNVPWSVYSIFHIEEKYGFNNMTVGTFIWDEIKKFLIVIVLMAIVIPLLLWLIAISGEAMVLTLAGSSIVIVLVISLLVPTLIVPMFFELTDLEDGELRKSIEAEAEACGVGVAEIKVIDGSKRSSHSNAFVSGWGSFRKVVLFDTLIAQHPPNEIVAVVNHELGHVVHGHIVKQVIM